MKKYIPADKLIAEIERLRNECAKSIGDGFVDGDLPKTMTSGGAAWACEQLLSFITSLQQEQPEFPTTDEEVEKALASIPKVELPDKYKTTDWLFKHQGQPEVDLEKDIDAFFDKWDKNSNGAIFDENGARVTIETIKGVVKHFLNARKEGK